MVENDVNIQIGLKEIYKVCCPNCKKHIRSLVKDKIAESTVDKLVGGAE
jgi:hypothetical protein